jgi:hypothetical protein
MAGAVGRGPLQKRRAARGLGAADLTKHHEKANDAGGVKVSRSRDIAQARGGR